jgi:hypothetical protein
MHMGGPIVRTGTTPKFWEGWERAMADEPKAKKTKKAVKSKKKAARKKASK